MGKIIIGKVAFTPQGAYDSSVTYAKYDMVYEYLTVFISLQDNNTAPLSDATAWKVLMGIDKVLGRMLADGAITTDKIGAGEVKSVNIGQGEVKSANIADGAVTNAKIGAGEVKSGHIGDGEVKSANIADGAVQIGKIADGAVTSEKIASGSVDSSKIADDAVEARHIAEETLTRDKFAPGAIDNIYSIFRDLVDEFEPITINGDVTNAPDEEDLTEKNGLLKLRDRLPLHGMGYKILRRRVIDVYPDDVWAYKKAGDVVYLLYTYGNIWYGVYDSTTGKGLGLANNLVTEIPDYDVNALPELAQGHYLSYTTENNVHTITLPNGDTITSTALNNHEIFRFDDVEPETRDGILVQSDFDNENTIYVIQYDFNIYDGTVGSKVLNFTNSQVSSVKTIEKINLDAAQAAYDQNPSADNLKALNNARSKYIEKGSQDYYYWVAVIMEPHHSLYLSGGAIQLNSDKTDIIGKTNDIVYSNQQETIYIGGYSGEYSFIYNNYITIPEGCVLKFEGGSLRNGTIVGNGTYIETSSLGVFKNILIDHNEGQFTNDAIVVDWFAEETDADKIQVAFQFMRYNKSAVKFLNRTYYLNKTVVSHANQVTLLGTSNGGDMGRTGCVITASEEFESEYDGNPLFYLNPLNSEEELGYNSVRIDGINIEHAPNNDGIQFLSAGGPSRPFFVEHCSFIGLNKAINVLNSGSSTEIANFVVERNTFHGNSWNIFARGRHAIMQFVFNNNVAEQCSGCINMGYTDEHSASGAQEPVPTTSDDFGYVCTNNIVITNNLLEGTVDTIYINGGPLYITITGNYFERGTVGYRQFIRLSTSTHSSLRFYNNFESRSGTIGLYIDSPLFKYTEIRDIPMESVVLQSVEYQMGTRLGPLVKTQGVVGTINKVPIGLDTKIDGCDILRASSTLFPYSDGCNRYILFQNDGETDTTYSNISISRDVKAGDVLVLLSSVIIDDIYTLMNFKKSSAPVILLGTRIRKLDNTYTSYVNISAITQYSSSCLEYCSKYVVPADGNLISFYIRGIKTGHPYNFRVKYFDVIHIPAEKVATGLLDTLAFYQEDKIIATNYNQLPTECPDGTKCYVLSIAKYLVKNGDKWCTEDGYPYAVKQGTTDNRPTSSMDTSTAGFKYYDTTINKDIVWDGERWSLSNGFAAVSTIGTSVNRPVGLYRTMSTAVLPTDVGKKVYIGKTIKNTSDNKYYIVSAISGDSVTWTEEDEYVGKSIPDTVRSSGQSQRPGNEYAYNNLYVGFEYYNTSDVQLQKIVSMSRTGEGTTESPYVYSVKWEPFIGENVLVNWYSKNDVGFQYYDTTLGITIYAKKIANNGDITWVDEEGNDLTGVTSVRGDTTTREAMTLTSVNAGLKYYDTTLNKYVLWNGTAWTNLDGSALS